MVTGPPGRRPWGPHRRGHSLPELVVAVTFLATTMVAVGGTMVLGGRGTARAVARQEAVRLAVTVLDSVAAHGVGSGERVANGLRARWSPGARGTDIRVVVLRESGGPVLATLEGPSVPEIPVLPDRGRADTVGSGWW